MKKLVVTLLILTLILFNISYAEVIQVVAGTDQISAAYESANPGDVLELVTDGGAYVETGVLRVQKDIVIRGAEGLTEKPIWQCAFSAYYYSDIYDKDDMESAAIEHYTNADLRLENMVITGLYGDMEAPNDSLDYTYQAIHIVSMPGDTLLHKFQLICDNVDFHFFHKEEGSTSGNLVRMAGFCTEIASLLKFTNCGFYESGRGLKFDPGDAVFVNPWDDLIVENCTFAKIKKDHPFLFQCYPDSNSLYSPPVLINHCTFVGSKDDMLKPKDCHNIRLENSIFFDIRDQLISNHGDGASAYFNNNCYWDVAYKEENRPLFAENVVILENEGNVSVYPFAEQSDYIKAVANYDADFYPLSEYDFTLSDSAAINLIGNDGKPLGDQKWVPTNPNSIQPEPQVAERFELSQNYPNPFNPTTTIQYTIPANSLVKLSIYDITGRNIRTIVNEHQTRGRYSVQWNGRNNQGVQMSSGIYFYKLDTGTSNLVKKMILTK